MSRLGIILELWVRESESVNLSKHTEELFLQFEDIQKRLHQRRKQRRLKA